MGLGIQPLNFPTKLSIKHLPVVKNVIIIFSMNRPLPEDTETNSPKPTTSNSSKKAGRSGPNKSASKKVKDELWLGKYFYF